MFDFFREVGQSADEKRSALLNAYLDGALSPRDKGQLEAQLQQDVALRADLEQTRLVKEQLLAMPRRRVPRSFSLDPALYGVPKSQRSQQLYPVLRGATALTALLFIFVLGLGLFNANTGRDSSAEAVSMAAQPQVLGAVPEAENAAAELSQESAPAAAASIMEAPAAGEMAESPTAETVVAEEMDQTPANASDAPEENARSTDENGTFKQFETTGEALATAPAAAIEPYAAADTAAANGPVDLSEQFQRPSALFPLANIAVWLGLATLVLGLVTLILRGRTRN